MGEDTQKVYPIGFWLKRADELITQRSNEALQEFGLTRPHWQALNSIHDAGRMTKEALLEMLRDFVDAARLEGILADFEAKHWTALEVDRGGKRLGLTPAGQEAHAAILEQQTKVRQRLAHNVSEEEYAVMMTVLRRIVSNLE
jgi:DNA-binding MarR family transcriptional regulator